MESISESPEKEKRKGINGINSNSGVDTEEFARKTSRIDDAAKEDLNGQLPNGTIDGEGKISEDFNEKEIDSSNEEKKGAEESVGELSDSNKMGTLSVEDVSVKEEREINGSELGVDESCFMKDEDKVKDSSEVVTNGQQSVNEAIDINGIKDGTQDVAKAQNDVANDDLVNIDDVAINVNGEINGANVNGDIDETENTTEIKGTEPLALNEHRSEADESLHQDETFDNGTLQPGIELVHSAIDSSVDAGKEITKSAIPENEERENALDFSDTALLLTKDSSQAPTALGNGSHLHEKLHKKNSSDIEIIDDTEGKSNANNKDGSHEDKVAKDVVNKIKSKKTSADGGKDHFDAIVSDSGEPDESNATCKLLIDEEVKEPTTSKKKDTKGGKVRQNMCSCYPRRRKNEQTQNCSVM